MSPLLMVVLLASGIGDRAQCLPLAAPAASVQDALELVLDNGSSGREVAPERAGLLTLRAPPWVTPAPARLRVRLGLPRLHLGWLLQLRLGFSWALWGGPACHRPPLDVQDVFGAPDAWVALTIAERMRSPFLRPSLLAPWAGLLDHLGEDVHARVRLTTGVAAAAGARPGTGSTVSTPAAAPAAGSATPAATPRPISVPRLPGVATPRLRTSGNGTLTPGR